MMNFPSLFYTLQANVWYIVHSNIWGILATTTAVVHKKLEREQERESNHAREGTQGDQKTKMPNCMRKSPRRDEIYKRVHEPTKTDFERVTH